MLCHVAQIRCLGTPNAAPCGPSFSTRPPLTNQTSMTAKHGSTLGTPLEAKAEMHDAETCHSVLRCRLPFVSFICASSTVAWCAEVHLGS